MFISPAEAQESGNAGPGVNSDAVAGGVAGAIMGGLLKG
jgi:hypothetical protein